MLMNLKNLINKYDMKINGVYHIGANIGQELNCYNELHIDKVIMFEPNKSCVNVIIDKLANNTFPENYEVHLCALGETTGNEVTLYDSSNNHVSSSILKPKEHLIQHPHVKFIGTYTAIMRKLDEFNDGVSNFINMDVQGYELYVLQGGEETLKNIDYIMTEVNYREIYENCTRFDILTPYLYDHGFRLVEESKTRHGWGDALFIRNK